MPKTRIMQSNNGSAYLKKQPSYITRAGPSDKHVSDKDTAASKQTRQSALER